MDDGRNAEHDALVEPSPWGIVPDGTYRAVLIGHETASVFRTAKVFLHFRIVEVGNEFGKLLYRAYRARALVGKPARNGKFKVARRSELLLMVYRVTHLKIRVDRLSFAELRSHVLRISTRTVSKDYQQRDLPQPLWYSVVDDVLGFAD